MLPQQGLTRKLAEAEAVPRILLVVFGPVATDPRVLRQIDALSDAFDITVAGYGPFDDSRVRFHALADAGSLQTLTWKLGRVWQLAEVMLCALRLYSLSYWLLHREHFRLGRFLRGENFDLVLINDSEGVAVATRAASPGTTIMHDQHEYWPDLFINPLKRWAVRGYREWYVRKYLAPLPNWITVAEGIGALYRENFGLTEPTIITNAPGFVALEPSPVEDTRIDLVYHGVWDPGRGIEVMIEALSMVDHRFHLNLIIVGHGSEHLRLVAERFSVSDRVHFVDPVPPRDIAAHINPFDVALVLNMPVNQSEKFALPNKVFESIQGRLALAVGPSPEIARVVTENQCGLVLDDFESHTLAKALTALAPAQIVQLKRKSHSAASRLSAEENAKILHDVVANLVAGTGPFAAPHS